MNVAHRALRARPLPALAWLALACPVTTGAQEAAPPPPSPAPPTVEQFFGDALLSEARISPDGMSIALRIGAKDRHVVLAVLPISTLQPTVVAGYAEQDVGRFQWVGAHRLVYDLVPKLVDAGHVESRSGLFGVNDDGRETRKLVETFGKSYFSQPDFGRPLLPINTTPLEPASPPTDNTLFVVEPGKVERRSADYFALSRLDTMTGRATPIDSPPHAQEFVFDASGALRAVRSVEDNRVQVLVRDPQGEWKSIDDRELFVAGGLHPRFLGKDGRLYLVGGRGSKFGSVQVYDTNRGEFADKPLLASDEFDIAPQFVISQGRLVGVRYLTDSLYTAWTDPVLQKAQEAVDRRLPGRVNVIDVPRLVAPENVLVESFADRLPYSYYLYNLAADRLTLIGSSHNGIDPRRMGKTYFIHYKARDGLQIPAYITFPAGRERKALPLVVLVHGGPFFIRDGWGWDPEVQFLASRGYVVLQPEYRGSGGFGFEHFHAGWKQWGLAMQNDLADGARWAIGEGLVDPRRICIAGSSYGGYAAIMGLINDPDLYRCGVAYAAVTDLRLLGSWAWSGFGDAYRNYGLPRLVGDPEADADQLRRTSPVENADRIRRPLLLAHGAFDSRVPVIHAERLREKLEGRLPGFEWVRYPEEPHGWVHPEARIDFWSRVERFLAANLSTP